MRSLKIPLSDHYKNHAALLFLEDGILLHAGTPSPFLPWHATQTQLGLTLQAAYLDGSTLVIRYNSPLPLAAILEQGFFLRPTKHFLHQNYQAPIQPLLFRAIHCVTWDRKLQYCSQCGHKVQQQNYQIEKKCPPCNISFFPHFSPAIMVLIQRDHEILLARSKHFDPGMYSALAGFIELGETAEMAAHREIREEVGLEIADLKYFGTQPWPFPDSFMIAFKAHYLNGSLKLDPQEIEDAQWFDVDHLPKLPTHSSIARALIDSWQAHR